MMTEGVGEKAPKPKKLILSDHDLACLKLEAESRAEFRQYATGESEWSRGLQSDVVIHGVGVLRKEVRPIFVGLIGEYSSCEFINRIMPAADVHVDLLRKKRGDYGIDITAFSLHLQVKTRQKADYGNLVRVVDERGNRKRHSSRAFIFCEWSGDKTCSVLGWQWTKNMLDYPVQDAIRGSHKNISVPDDDLLCMDRLISVLRAKRDLGGC